MKKLLLFLIVLLMPINAKAISAESAIVMDQETGRVLYGHNSERQKLIASITKIMTCLVAIENGDLTKTVTVTEDVLKAYGSAIYIEVGEEIPLIDLLYGLMLRSGNDAAIIIAKEVGGTSEKFVELMNKKAQKIGMKNSIFYNPHGLEENNGKANLSTAYDMALLTSVAMKNETFRTIFGAQNYVSKSSYKTYTWTNKNKLLKSYEYTTGGKTGYTEKAKRTLVTTASKDNKNLIVVTLNDGNDFADHKSLYETYFAKYQSVLVLDKNNFKVEDDDHYEEGELVIKSDYRLLVTESEKAKIKTEVELEKVTFKKDNRRVGTVKVYLGENLMHEEGIYIHKIQNIEEEKLGFWQKVWNFIKFWD